MVPLVSFAAVGATKITKLYFVVQENNFAVVLLSKQPEKHYYKENAKNKQGQEGSPFAGFFALLPFGRQAAMGLLSSSSSDETAGNLVLFRSIVCVLPFQHKHHNTAETKHNTDNTAHSTVTTRQTDSDRHFPLLLNFL